MKIPFLSALFGGGNKQAPKVEERSMREVLASAGSDWVTSGLSLDAEVYQNRYVALAAMRDLWRCNPHLSKYAEHLQANVFGENGIMLRSKIKETEDRVIYAPDDAPAPVKARALEEKWALVQHQRRIDRVRAWAASKGRSIPAECQYRALKLADSLDALNRDHVIRGKALVEVGAPDVYANLRVEGGWAEWQRAQVCDVRGLRDYNTLRWLALGGCARDGGSFVHMIRDTAVNRFGFAIRLVNDEWCDYALNQSLTDSDGMPSSVIRMGVKYGMNRWGIGKPQSYFFIKRQPRDWQSGRSFGYHGYNGTASIHEEVPADQIIHVARYADNESTRPAPWGFASLASARQLNQGEIAELVAMRAEACKTGWLYSDLVPEGGQDFARPDPKTGMPTNQLTPGGLYGLPFGVKFQPHDPTHPNGNFPEFRKAMGQTIAAGLPGADYNTTFNDLAGINFSAGRLGRLDTNEVNKMLQRFFIETVERPIFEAWLEMALISGALPLPASKLKKFNRPVFQGRRWAQVDENKAVDAAAKRIANKLSSRGRECAEEGIDFEDNAFELAEEEMLLEELGLSTLTTAETPAPAAPPEDDPEDAAAPNGDTEDDDEPAPAPKTNGKAHPKIDKARRMALKP